MFKGMYNQTPVHKTVDDVYSTYLLLDSRHRKIEGSPGSPFSKYKWEYTPTIYTKEGTTNSISQIQDILYIQIKSFHVPRNRSTGNAYKKISMLVEELSAHAVIGHENRRYNWMFNATPDGNRVLLSPPGVDEGKFRFSTPVTKLDQLTVTFGAPLTEIEFDADRYEVDIVPVGPTVTHIVFKNPHMVSSGEVVLITGFTTSTPLVDFGKMEAVNDNDGHTATLVDPKTLSITLDLTATTTPTPPPVVECFIASRRLLIDLRVVYARKAGV